MDNNSKKIEQTTTSPTRNTQPTKPAFAFDRVNFLILFIGLATILLGFFIMSMDKELYGFGFLGITLGPIILFIGFIIPIFAIFYKAKK